MKISPTPWKVCELDFRVVEDSDGFVVADVRNAIETDDAALLSVAPQMYDVISALSGSEGNWADPWLNDLAKKCSEIDLQIKANCK